jgi:O-antigen/teichoic acid export membrane protein
MNNTEKILKSSSIIIVGVIIGKTLGIINQALIGRLLGPNGFGDFALILTILQITTVIILLGTKTGVVKFISGYSGSNDKVGLSSLITQASIFNFLMSLIIVIISFFVLNIFFVDKFSKTTIQLILLLIPFYAFYPLLEGIVRGFGNTKYKVIAENLVKKLVRIIVFLALFYYAGFKIEGALIALFISFIIVVIFILFIINSKFISIKELWQNNIRDEIRGLLKYSWPLAFSSYILLLFNYIDILSLSYFKDSSDVGMYVAAFGISALIGIVPQSFTYMFFPTISHLVHSNERTEIMKTFSSTVKLSYVFSLFGMFIILTNGNLLIDIIYGDAYVDSYKILILLGLGQFTVYATGPTGSMLNALGKTRQTMICDISGGVINLTLNIPFVILWGTIGVALSTSISIMARNIMTLYYIKKNLGSLLFSKKYLIIGLLPLISIPVLFTLTTLEGLNNYISFLASLLLGGLSVYIIYLINFFNEEEINTLTVVFKKVIAYIKIKK